MGNSILGMPKIPQASFQGLPPWGIGSVAATCCHNDFAISIKVCPWLMWLDPATDSQAATS